MTLVVVRHHALELSPYPIIFISLPLTTEVSFLSFLFCVLYFIFDSFSLSLLLSRTTTSDLGTTRSDLS